MGEDAACLAVRMLWKPSSDTKLDLSPIKASIPSGLVMDSALDVNFPMPRQRRTSRSRVAKVFQQLVFFSCALHNATCKASHAKWQKLCIVHCALCIVRSALCLK